MNKCTARGPSVAPLMHAILLAALIFGSITADAAAETSAAPRASTSLPGHVPAALSKAKLMQSLKSTAIDAPLSLTVVLKRSDVASFEAYLSSVYDPNAPSYRQFLSPAEISNRYGPSADDYDAVKAYFVGQGFGVTAESANRLTLVVAGTRATAERALGVQIKDYQIKDKRFYANASDPVMPKAIADRIQGITGLSNLATPTANVGLVRAVFCYAIFGGLNAIGAGSALDFFGLKNCINWAIAGYGGAPAAAGGGKRLQISDANLADMRAAGASALGLKSMPAPWQSVDGTGQKIGLVEFDSFLASDLRDNIAIYGMPSARINQVTQTHVGSGAVLGANQSEVLLDIMLPLFIAPGATVAVYDAPLSSSFQAVFNSMIGGGVTIISNSWSYCEDQTTLADVQTNDSIFQTAAASGITVLNASGDNGSTCLDGHPNVVGVPADAPHATAVGGTTLKPPPGLVSYGTETWWGALPQTPPTGQGGFGSSQFFARPSYQNALVAGPSRSVPDLALAADPMFDGIPLCIASAGGCPTGLIYGGTSMSAPLMASFVALINQSLTANLGFLNPTLYPLAGTAAFHTASSMGSDFAHVGLGSPNLGAMDAALSGAPASPVNGITSVVNAVPPSPATVFADGVNTGVIGVVLLNASGHPVPGKTVSLSASPSGHVVITPTTATTDSNGAATFTVTDLTVETVGFTATDVTDSIALSQVPTIQFVVPAAASAGIVASPSSVPADGTTPATVTVTLKDALNRPTPGKTIALSQGSGHSVIASPTPAVTDSNGQIQFQVTDGVSETVTYTATDVTDNNLAVPGSAQVTFSGSSTTTCAATAPTAAPGFALTTFANGFPAAAFNFSNVNWGCAGASNPAFDTSGNVFVSSFYDGKLYKFGLAGGAVSSANTVATIGQTLQQAVFGRDGSLYLARAATGGNFNTGTVLQVDPATGAVLKTLATGLTCPSQLTLDPLSGDLFLTDTCFGGGSDNPTLFRIQNPASATPALVNYATLGGTPNGVIAISPDGSLYVVVGYTSVKTVVKVGGTNTSSPPTQTVLAGITSDYSITIGQVLPNGAAKSLLVGNNNALKLVDITTSPFTTTVLANGSISSGTIGPDGCIYAAATDTIFKLAPASGGCGFLPTNPTQLLSLSPTTVAPNPAQGSATTLTASFINGTPAAGTPVIFRVTGANAQIRLANTDANGIATVSLTGVNVGIDTVVATATVGSTAFTSNAASITWTSGAHVTLVSLAGSPASSTVAQVTTLSAALFDASLTPNAALAGQTMNLAVGSLSCTAVTNANGAAACNVTTNVAGSFTMTASFAGNASYTASSASQSFAVYATASAPTSPGPPTIGIATAGNGFIAVAFTAPASDGGSPITSYATTCTPTTGSVISGVGASSPVIVPGAVNGVTYVCTVNAINGVGAGAASAASNAVTPMGSVATVAPIPTVDRAALAMMAILLAMFGLVAMRRGWGSRR